MRTVALLLFLVPALPQERPEGGGQEPALALRSILTNPLYLGEEPPDCRSARNIQIVHTGVENVSPEVTRTPEEARELAAFIVNLIRSGADFVELATEYSAARNVHFDAVLGTFPRGSLKPDMDRFLFNAGLWDVSPPFENELGVHVMQRVDRFAAVRQIFLRGKSPETLERATGLIERIRAGADFAELAKRTSEDPDSAARGGDFRIFERGSRDRLLKAAAFGARVGEVVGPIESPLGYHILQRVPIEEVDPSLREVTDVRVRTILISQESSPSGVIFHERTAEEALELAQDIHRRVKAGEDMAALAREYNDDVTGKEREGDIGWLHRRNPGTAQFLAGCFLVEPGELLDLT
ncbi:MAG: peptidylprolyl isomerase, partial [Planctomycetota bacterium]|nr:peptidylprolyl isomerase [Planctomycetota bacterium]